MSHVISFPNAHLPSKRELRMRRLLCYQLVRFAALNIKMLKMVLQGHH